MVPISAMLVLAVGGAEGAALDRVYETLIGAGVGVAVNVVIAAPLYVQPANDALGELAERMAAFLRQLADQLGAGWSRESADRMLNEARRLGVEVDRADRTLARAQDSARFNPRVAQAREALPRLRTGLTGLEIPTSRSATCAVPSWTGPTSCPANRRRLCTTHRSEVCSLRCCRLRRMPLGTWPR